MAKTQGDHVIKGTFRSDGNAKFVKGTEVPYLEIIDQKDKGTPGGTFTGFDPGVNSWRTRDLVAVLFNDFATAITTFDDDVPGQGGDITLEAGVYYAEISCPAFSVDEHVARLADVTDNPGAQGSTVILGTSEYAADSALWEDSQATPGTPNMQQHSSTQSRSIVSGKFQLTTQRTLEIQHRCSNTQDNEGFGSDGNFYEAPNIYTTVKMWQIRSDD